MCSGHLCRTKQTVPAQNESDKDRLKSAQPAAPVLEDQHWCSRVNHKSDQSHFMGCILSSAYLWHDSFGSLSRSNGKFSLILQNTV